MRLPWQTSDLHPHALSLDDDALHVSDLPSALAADLTDLNPPKIIHRFRVVAPFGDHEETFKSLGFTATRLTRVIDLPLNAVTSAVPNRYARHWFKQGERAPWPQWLDAHWRHYVNTHHSNPPRVPRKGLRHIFVGTDMIEALALRDGPQGRVRSFASLRKDQELGWIGGQAALLKPTLATALRRATAIGWTKATLEVDDDDRPLWSLAQTLPTLSEQTFTTWQKERQSLRRPN